MISAANKVGYQQQFSLTDERCKVIDEYVINNWQPDLE